MSKNRTRELIGSVGIILLVIAVSIFFPKSSEEYKLLNKLLSSELSPTNVVAQAKQDKTKDVLGVTDKSPMTVTKIIDGDTIQLENGEKLRYIGIDTPETVDPRRGLQCFGHEASDYNKSLVLDKKVRLVKDISERDSFGRLLRYVYLIPETPEGKEVLVNEMLVRQGYAYAVSFPPDIAFQSLFQEAQKDAAANKRGLWNVCPAKK